MPKFPKSFGRRRSTANVFEDVQETPVAEPSFKVFERPDGGSKSFDGGVKLGKAVPGATLGPVGRPRTSHKTEENLFEHLYSNRGSAGSNTNTVSTADNSSRLSAASTAPSSTDIKGEEWRSPHDKSFNDIPVPPIPKSTSGFSLKSAGRSLSWGRNSKAPTPPLTKELPNPPLQRGRDSPPVRSRAVTASSYASTATPPKLDERDLGLSLGGDFGDMFADFGKRKSAILLQENSRALSRSPDAFSTAPASRSYSSDRSNQPAPLNLSNKKDVEPSPYSWSSQHSRDGLISNSSPPPIVPPNEDLPPPVPRHTSPTTTRPKRPDALADTGLRRSSGGRRQSNLDYDEDARLLRESVIAGRKLNDTILSPPVRDSWALPSGKTYNVEDSTTSDWNIGSTNATPKARKQAPSPNPQEDGLFDNQIAAAANLAERFQERPSSPQTTHGPANMTKVLTPAQFERYKQDQERLRSVGGRPKDDEEEEDDENYDDEEDEMEKNRQLAKQRRKQEAHMAVYRQQMMKVTGDTARPVILTTQSTPDLATLGNASEGEEEDEEVPLAILQAHGFPNKNKPPVRSMGSIPNLRAQSVIGGAVPVFARNLPQDPYFGAGIVNASHRESLAFGGGVGSVVAAAPSRALPPGGLVGVIATEERSRAMRRGSPNAHGEYGPLPPPSNGFNGMAMPPSLAMMNGMGPMAPMGMNPMMLTPGDQAQIQMSQQMQQFMQMQMQFMQMMTSGQAPPQQSPMPQQSLGQIPVAGSPSIQVGSSQQRAMTMMDPNSAPWLPQISTSSPSVRNLGGGYAPSIAPSERSNIGLPGRYRPVSQAPPQDRKSRASTMSGALQGWESKNGPSTIRPVKNAGNTSDEDDEEGWEEMAKKREKKKSLWRTKKDTNGFKDLLRFAQ